MGSRNRFKNKNKNKNNKENTQNQTTGFVNLGAAKPRRGTTVSTKGSTVRYPSAYDITQDTDYVSVDFYKYDPPFGKGFKQKGSTGGESSSTLYTSYNASIGDNLAENKDTRFKSVLLYMPEDVNAQYGANWGSTGFGMGQAALAKFFGTEGENAKNMWGNTVEILRGGLKAVGYGFTKDLMNLGLGGNITTNQLMGGVSGTILNPNVELMYEAPEMRGFNLNFKMMARSPGEARDIRLICQQFKKAMLPSWGGQTRIGGKNEKTGSLITIPNIVKVSFMQGNKLNPYVSQFKPCAITNVNINYTPDGSYATYDDGSPVATALTVQFKELKLVFAEEIDISSNPTASY